MSGLTPMMEQYMKIKEKYPSCLVFFRLGDFYEMFFDDAIAASKELGLALTGRDCGLEERAPMCGVPHHSVDAYIARLVEKGHKVAICEQTEAFKSAKNIVNRDVVRIVTPGTIQDQNVLDKEKNNFIMSLYESPNRLGISAADTSTGEFYTYSIIKNPQLLIDEVFRFAPAEIITLPGFSLLKVMSESLLIKPAAAEDYYYHYETARNGLCAHFGTLNLEGFGIEGDKDAICAAGGLLSYLGDTQKNALRHLSSLKLYHYGEYMAIDAASRRNLELCETLREKKKKGSLLWVLDKTKTAMGARILRKWLTEPLTDIEKIELRLDTVGEFKREVFHREELRELLQNVNDIERLMSRIIYGIANARDLLSLKRSIGVLGSVRQLLRGCGTSLCGFFYSEIDLLDDIFSLIEAAIADEPPAAIRDGGFIKDGFNTELDGYRDAKNKGAGWILDLEARERELSSIKTLKIKYNKVFGYYIELTKSNQRLAPERYIRVQTLSNCERYTTPELKEIEEGILGAGERIIALELTLFNELCEKISSEVSRVQKSANILAVIDALQSFAEAADKNNYVRPLLNRCGSIEIKDGRHPVVELTMGEGKAFIPNDTFINTETDRLLTLTGPNMAGKSTYMRQVALIVLMTQTGSFVPASYANISAADKIFTRVGASDDLATGQSTFMVEMAEVSNILVNATSSSLIILDEIGRGTSTYDGLSIAWAVLEYIADKSRIGAKTLFATHYHEMTELEGKVPGVVNYCVQVKESGDNIVFLRKIARGGADRSYGIHVARLAGLPGVVISRAIEIMATLSSTSLSRPQRETVFYGTNRRKGISGNRVTIEQIGGEDDAQLTIRDILKNI